MQWMIEKSKKMKKLIIVIGIVAANYGFAQTVKDTVPTTQTIKVKSSFKPVLRNANKQSFYATPPVVDTTKPTLTYTVPSQNLFFTYQPVPLKPLALTINKDLAWENNNYIKVGYGNWKTPYVSAGFSFGDGKTTSLGVFADYIGSKGSLLYQQYSKLGVSVQGSKSIPKGFEFKGRVGYNIDEFNLYGYNNSVYTFTKDQVKQRFQTISFSTGVRNTMPTEFGLNYNPTLQASIFSDNRSGTETNLLLNVPLTKNIGEKLGFKIGAMADMTFYKKPSVSINNSIFYVTPAITFKTPKVSINGGVTPAWENGTLNILPDVTADFQLQQGKKFVVQLGWLGYYNKGSYQRWASINPYLAQPTTLPNTKVDERFVGFKGTSGNHIVYAIKAAYMAYNNMPLFVNDTFSGKSFNVVKESKLQTVQLHGEVGVIEKEVFHLTAGFNLNNFISLKDNAKAWGILPLEITGALRWQLFKDFWLKSDAYVWNGANFRTKTNTVDKMKFVLDLNAGVEFKVAKQFNVWFQANNLVNTKYQRWRNYETYGLNILGGIKYTFSTIPKSTVVVSN
jgi:hypothetical protein